MKLLKYNMYVWENWWDMGDIMEYDGDYTGIIKGYSVQWRVNQQ